MIFHCFGDNTRLFDPHYFGRQKVLRQSEMIKLFIGKLENDLGMQTSINQSRKTMENPLCTTHHFTAFRSFEQVFDPESRLPEACTVSGKPKINK